MHDRDPRGGPYRAHRATGVPDARSMALLARSARSAGGEGGSLRRVTHVPCKARLLVSLALAVAPGCSASSGGPGGDRTVADGPTLEVRSGDLSAQDAPRADRSEPDASALDDAAGGDLCQADPSLVLCLPLDEDPRGGTVTDQSGAGNHGTVVGVPTTVAGVQGQALHFSGAATEHVMVPTSNSLGPPSLRSVEAWIRLDALPAGTVGVVDRGADAVAIVVQTDDGKPWVGCRGGVNSITEKITLGRWTHAACVVVEPDQTQLFVDGVGGSSVLMVLSSASGCDLRIGASCYSHAERSFPGAIDGVRIYNRPLTREELCLAAGRSWNGSSCS